MVSMELADMEDAYMEQEQESMEVIDTARAVIIKEKGGN